MFAPRDLVAAMVVGMAVLGLAPGSPVPTPKPTTTEKHCNLGMFKSLSPRELQAFKTARDALEDAVSSKTWRCHSDVFSSTRDLRQLQVWERPVALEAELALTLKVLGTVSDSVLRTLLEQPLHTLHHIHSKLRACVPAEPSAGPRPRGRLHRWLHRLQEAMKMETQSCLEASVTSNLFRLLLRDLRCVASGDQCV